MFMSEIYLGEGKQPWWAGQDTHQRYGGTWTIFGESFSSYLEDFQRVDKDGILPVMIDELVKKDRPIMIDLLAPTSTLSDFTRTYRQGRPIRGLAVGCSDQRDDFTIEEDQELGIEYIPTDLRHFRNLDLAKDWLGEEKADLVMERGYGGLKRVHGTQGYYMEVAQRVWDMVNPNGGLILMQMLPKVINQDLGKLGLWLEELRRRKVYYQILPSYTSKDNGNQYGLLMLLKTQGALLPDCKALDFSEPSSQNLAGNQV